MRRIIPDEIGPEDAESFEVSSGRPTRKNFRIPRLPTNPGKHSGISVWFNTTDEKMYMRSSDSRVFSSPMGGNFYEDYHKYEVSPKTAALLLGRQYVENYSFGETWLQSLDITNYSLSIKNGPPDYYHYDMLRVGVDIYLPYEDNSGRLQKYVTATEAYSYAPKVIQNRVRRYSFAAILERCYVIAGFNDFEWSSGVGHARSYEKQNSEYNSISSSWAIRRPILEPARADASAWTILGSIFVLGGTKVDSELDVYYQHTHHTAAMRMSDLTEYKSATDAWLLRKPSPNRKSHLYVGFAAEARKGYPRLVDVTNGANYDPRFMVWYLNSWGAARTSRERVYYTDFSGSLGNASWGDGMHTPKGNRSPQSSSTDKSFGGISMNISWDNNEYFFEWSKMSTSYQVYDALTDVWIYTADFVDITPAMIVSI